MILVLALAHRVHMDVNLKPKIQYLIRSIMSNGTTNTQMSHPIQIMLMNSILALLKGEIFKLQDITEMDQINQSLQFVTEEPRGTA